MWKKNLQSAGGGGGGGWGRGIERVGRVTVNTILFSPYVSVGNGF